MSRDVPVHDSLEVLDATDLYRTGEWWKAVVTVSFENSSDRSETAVYLWHKDGEDWTRKNKYVIKTPEAWATDREIIDRYIRSEPPSSVTKAFPVSNYYTVAVGETIFQDNDWWKAIVNVVKKGSYETNQVMVYLWQKVEDEWRRRQKYAIKSASDWEDECRIVDSKISTNETAAECERADETGSSVSTELSELSRELDNHLSEEFSETSA